METPRYLIQNMTGMMMSYWAPAQEVDARLVAALQVSSARKLLPPGCSEELQVTPTAKEVKIVGPGGVVVTRLQAQVITLKFEGTWMPISGARCAATEAPGAGFTPEWPTSTCHLLTAPSRVTFPVRSDENPQCNAARSGFAVVPTLHSNRSHRACV